MNVKLNKSNIIFILFVVLLSLNTKVNAKERILRTYYANQGTTITIQSGDHASDWKYNNCLYSAAKTSSGLKNHGWKYSTKTGEVKIPNDDDDFEIAYLEERIRTAKQKLAQEKSKVNPSHITIQGNSAPINLGGILATDDAVINRSTVSEGPGDTSYSAFCPRCGTSVEEGDIFCRKCGRKL